MRTDASSANRIVAPTSAARALIAGYSSRFHRATRSGSCFQDRYNGRCADIPSLVSIRPTVTSETSFPNFFLIKSLIKARAAEVGATILFADEASVRTDYHAGTTWAPVGQTPVVTASAVRQAVKMVSAIGQRGELSFQVHEGSMNAERFVEFLTSLLHDFDTPVFLVVDGSSVHKARIVKDYVASTEGRLELFFLPPYSPELNPDEWVNKNVKHDRIARAVPLTRDELKAVALDALERLKRCPGIVRGFFGDPKLAYIHA